MQQPVDGELVEALWSLPFGERLRALRLARGVKSQAALLARLEKRTGTSRSAAWLSGIENGSLDPTPERRRELVLALGLEGVEADLLAAPAEEPHVKDHDLVAYAAWQSVRLTMADELIRDSNDADARARGRSVRDRLKDVLTSDDELWTASGKQLGSLGPFLDLPEVTRWMLLVEATHMQPFLPYEPMANAWNRNRDRAVDRIAEELGLDVSSDQRRALHRQRVPGLSLKWLSDHEPKALETPTGGASEAALFIADPNGDSRLIRGESSVGSLGWWAACGRYALAIVDTAAELGDNRPSDGMTSGRSLFALTPSRVSLPGAALLSSSMPLLGSAGSGPLSIAATREALARGRLRQHQNAAFPTRTTGSQHLFPGVGLLAALGPRAMRNDLARLVTVYVLRHLSDRPWERDPENEVPSARRAAENLSTAARGLRGYHDELAVFEARDSAFSKDISAASTELDRASRALANMADLVDNVNTPD